MEIELQYAKELDPKTQRVKFYQSFIKHQAQGYRQEILGYTHDSPDPIASI